MVILGVYLQLGIDCPLCELCKYEAAVVTLHLR